MRGDSSVPDRRSVSERIERARLLWGSGKKREALESLKAAVRAELDNADLRRALADLYRDLGCPDQAGRWGIAIDGWTTAIERDRLARLLASSGVVREDAAAFLSLPSASIADIPELVALMDGAVADYQEKFAADRLQRSDDRWGGRTTLIAMFAWLATLIAWVSGLMALYAVALLDVADPQWFARLVGACVLSAIAVALLATSVASAIERRTLATAVAGFGGAVCGGIAIALFVPR